MLLFLSPLLHVFSKLTLCQVYFYFSAAGPFTDSCVIFVRFYVTMLNVLFFTSCQNDNHSSQNGGWTIGVSLDHRKCGQLKHTHTHTLRSQTVISSHPCPITAGFTTERAKVINLSPNPKCIGRHEGAPAHYYSTLTFFYAPWTTGCLFGLPAPHPPPSSSSSSRSFPTGRSRSGTRRSQTRTGGFSTFASGASVSGWMW